MGGRKKRDYVWIHYRIGQNKSVICKHCDHKYVVSNVTKMYNHLLKCDKCPSAIKNELKQKMTFDNESSVTQIQSPPSGAIEPSLDADVSRSNLINQPSTSRCEPVEEDNHDDDIIKKFAKAVFISGSPLSLVEHPLWIDFFSSLETSFKMPSRKTLSTTLLDKVHSEIKKEVSECLKTTSYLHLQCDGWSNVNNAGVINFIISNPAPYFVESLSTEDNRHTSLYLSNEILKVIRTHGESKFVVLIGDNVKNFPHVIPLNCVAHTLNLLSHDIIKRNVIKNIIDLAVDVIKGIKKSQILSSRLNKIIKELKIGESLKLPSKTRWGSHLNSLKTLKSTKQALLNLAVQEIPSLSSEIKSTLLDDSFWVYVENVILILEPVVAPIFILESNENNIHNVFTIFKDIKSKLEFTLPTIDIISDNDKSCILEAVDNRKEMCIKPIHLAAHLLDPKAQGFALDADESIEAMEFVDNMARNLNINAYLELVNYKAKEDFWGKRFLWEKIHDINPVTWWKGLCQAKNLSKVAVRILTAPCTSAATERSFSKHGFMHSKLRNRLTPERAAKLAFVSYNWDLLKKHVYSESEVSVEENVVGISSSPISPNDFRDNVFPDHDFSQDNSVMDIEFFDVDSINEND